MSFRARFRGPGIPESRTSEESARARPGARPVARRPRSLSPSPNPPVHILTPVSPNRERARRAPAPDPTPSPSSAVAAHGFAAPVSPNRERARRAPLGNLQFHRRRGGPTRRWVDRILIHLLAQPGRVVAWLKLLCKGMGGGAGKYRLGVTRAGPAVHRTTHASFAFLSSRSRSLCTSSFLQQDICNRVKFPIL